MDKLGRIKIPAVVEDEKMDIIYDAIKNGGGGGGDGAIEIIKNTVNLGTGDITTTKTAKEIVDDAKKGKILFIPVDLSYGEDITIAQLVVGAVVVNEYGPTMVAGTFGGDGPQSFIFRADSLDDPFVGNINNN